MAQILDILLHLDQHLIEWVTYLGPSIYILLFAIVFAETGLVIFPFLPGDSLLFAIGAIAALDGEHSLNLWILLISLTIAGILGNTVNYHIGRKMGLKIFEKLPFLKDEYLDSTEEFFKKWGAFAIVAARFAPIMRTFAPFVAGIAKMDYAKFHFYNIVGCVSWVFSLVLAGYFFGNFPIVKNNFQYVVMAIIIISGLPIVLQITKGLFNKIKTRL